jgi:hypothetical protein
MALVNDPVVYTGDGRAGVLGTLYSGVVVSSASAGCPVAYINVPGVSPMMRAMHALLGPGSGQTGQWTPTQWTPPPGTFSTLY